MPQDIHTGSRILKVWLLGGPHEAQFRVSMVDFDFSTNLITVTPGLDPATAMTASLLADLAGGVSSAKVLTITPPLTAPRWDGVAAFDDHAKTSWLFPTPVTLAQARGKKGVVEQLLFRLDRGHLSDYLRVVPAPKADAP
jgi:hypothetical protein